ncbi:MAG TPA: LpqB family beta-propeller domain-containing protein [Actinopolymorphaceae bacterium]
MSRSVSRRVSASVTGVVGRSSTGGARAPARRIAVLLMALLLAGALGACARVPVSGPISYVPMGTGEPENPSVPVLVSGPAPGDTAMQVARGFIDAMASYQSGQPIARKYLAPSVRERWRPERVLIYDSGEVPLIEPEPGKIYLDVPKHAELRPNGSWEPAEPDEKIKHDLKMTKVRGEWRIGSPPDALIMSSYNFWREYRQFDLYFFDSDFRVLVPDPVYLPIRGHVETLLVKALLRGPSPWLRPAVRSAFPEQTQLAAPAVTVEGGEATVELDHSVLDMKQRCYLLTQLARTLGQVHSGEIKVTVDQVPLGLRDTWTPDDENVCPTYDPSASGASRGAYALSNGRVLIVGSERLVAAGGTLGEKRVSARSMAVSISGERAVSQLRGREAANRTSPWIATVSTDGRTVTVYDPLNGPQVVWRGVDLAEPSWDRAGQLWLVDRNHGEAEIVVLKDHVRQVKVRAPGLAGEDVRGLKVSPEGTRVAALVDRDGRSRLLVGRISRGNEIVIDGLRELPTDLTSMSDLAWSDLDQLAVLGADSGLSRIVLVSVDGSKITPEPAGPDARSLAAAPGQPVLIDDADGRLFVEDPNYLWFEQGEATCPAYPG